MDGLDLNVWPCHPHGSWQRALAHKAMGLPVDDEDAKEKLYTYATPVLGITNFHGLQTTVIEQDE